MDDYDTTDDYDAAVLEQESILWAHEDVLALEDGIYRGTTGYYAGAKEWMRQAYLKNDVSLALMAFLMLDRQREAETDALEAMHAKEISDLLLAPVYHKN